MSTKIKNTHQQSKKSFLQLIRLLKSKNRGKINFMANPSLVFPKAEVEQIRQIANKNEIQVVTNLFGLIGATGILPLHYTEQVLQQLKQKQTALLDFYNAFHHRILELYYTAWHEQNIIVDYEQNNNNSKASQLLNGLLGFSENKYHDMLRHTSYFSDINLSKQKLVNILQDHTQLKIEIVTNMAIYKKLPESDLSKFSREKKQNRNNRLGKDWILGESIRMDHAHFNINIIATDAKQHRKIINDNNIPKLIERLTKTYVGNAYKFSINITLPHSQRIKTQFTRDPKIAAILGKNSFL